MPLIQEKYDALVNDETLLWHYTDLAGLKGITNYEGEIWATDAQYLNDTQELVSGMTTLRQRFTKYPAIIDWFNKCDRERIAQRNVYVTSFSGAGDLLSQWRGYHASFAIGFRRDVLSEAMKPFKFELKSCVYSDDDAGIEALMKPLLDELMEASLLLKDGDKEGAQKKESAVIEDVIPERYFYAAQIKNSAFKEEKESRLILAHDPASDRNIHHFGVLKTGRGARLDCRTSHGLTVPFIRIPIVPIAPPDPKHPQPSPIAAVMIGPCSHPALVADTIRRYLPIQYLHGIQIETTNVPYRS